MMSNFNWVDYLFIAIFILSIISGFIRGIVKEIISLLTLIAAFIIATAFSSRLAEYFTHTAQMQNAVDQASTAMNVNAGQPISYVTISLSFALLFAGTIILGAIIGFFINLVMSAGILGIGNRLLGGVFGFCRAVIITIAIIFVVQLTSFGDDEAWHQSQLVKQSQPAVQYVGKIVSPGLANLKERFTKSMSETMQKVGHSVQGVTQQLDNINKALPAAPAPAQKSN